MFNQLIIEWEFPSRIHFLKGKEIPIGKGGNKEHLSIDVDMDGGMDVKMDYLVLLRIKDVVMVDTNEGVVNVVLGVVNDNVMAVVVLVGKSASIEVVGNICLQAIWV
jgi:hypothetical protein